MPVIVPPVILLATIFYHITFSLWIKNKIMNWSDLNVFHTFLRGESVSVQDSLTFAEIAPRAPSRQQRSLLIAISIWLPPNILQYNRLQMISTVLSAGQWQNTPSVNHMGWKTLSTRVFGLSSAGQTVAVRHSRPFSLCPHFLSVFVTLWAIHKNATEIIFDQN